MRLIAIVAAMTAVSAQAGEFHLSKDCERRIESKALTSELARMAANGELLASDFETGTFLSYKPSGDTVTVNVRLDESVDGRSVTYSAKPLKSDAKKCEFQLVRKDSSVCRYSRDEGPESLNDIRGMNFKSGRTIKATTKLSALEKLQIRAFLASENSEDDGTIPDFINSTDDKELSTGTLILPNGNKLTYFGAYGGDNPFGIFFKSGTIEIAGKNGDGSVCIK